MCTIGYSKTLNLLFKNRDKTTEVSEVAEVRPHYHAMKTEGADYYSLGINSNNCGFVSAAVNTPLWTSLASQGKIEAAAEQFRKENVGLVNPMSLVSKFLPEAKNADEWLDKILASGQQFIGYNLILADRRGALHVELYRDQVHVTRVLDQVVVTNHFKHLDHGPKQEQDYPDSFLRLAAAETMIHRVLGAEDLFRRLVPTSQGTSCPFWRIGAFSTVSSAVLDLDASTLYYCADPEAGFSRLSRGIPPKGAERVAIEMSRYIDLPTYHKIERGHPFYEEMIQEILDQLASFHSEQGTGKRLRTMELGAGTGLCSLELARLPYLDLHCLELDAQCCAILSSHPEVDSYKVIQGDAVCYADEEGFDLIVSTFAHDHIHYNRRFAFAANIRKNLRPGGRYIMGGELLPYFSSDTERKKSLFRYHNNIIELALREERVQLCELENNALKSGLDLVGDFKRHEKMFEEEMASSGLKVVEKIKLGPLDRDDVGGVYVYVCQA